MIGQNEASNDRQKVLGNAVETSLKSLVVKSIERYQDLGCVQKAFQK
jgi:hypothetical protein